MNESDIILYTTPVGQVRVEVYFEDEISMLCETPNSPKKGRHANSMRPLKAIYTHETFWLSQRKMAELFDKDVRTINEHLKNIFDSGELGLPATIRKFRIVQQEDEREVAKNVNDYIDRAG